MLVLIRIQIFVILLLWACIQNDMTLGYFRYTYHTYSFGTKSTEIFQRHLPIHCTATFKLHTHDRSATYFELCKSSDGLAQVHCLRQAPFTHVVQLHSQSSIIVHAGMYRVFAAFSSPEIPFIIERSRRLYELCRRPGYAKKPNERRVIDA
jgi:hypothetical protein